MAGSIQMTPPMYASGQYQVRAPFEIDETITYVTHAIRSFKDCAARGMNVWKDIYEANGISEADYLADSKLGANIITLMSEAGPTLYVPDTFILAYPNMGEAVPQRVFLSIDLGVITSHWNENWLINQVENLASDVVGGTPKAKIHVAPVMGAATASEAALVEGVRQVSVKNRTSDYARALNAENQVDYLTEKTKALEKKLLG